MECIETCHKSAVSCIFYAVVAHLSKLVQLRVSTPNYNYLRLLHEDTIEGKRVNLHDMTLFNNSNAMKT